MQKIFKLPLQAFGFISAAGLLIQAFLNFREFQASGAEIQDVGAHVPRKEKWIDDWIKNITMR